MIRILTSGAAVNVYLVLLGSLFGLALRRTFPEKIKNALMNALALCVLYIGLDGIVGQPVRPMVVILSMVLGTALGTLCHLDDGINALGKKVEGLLTKNGGENTVAEGFVSATLLFCVGAMTVVGSINAGVSGDNSTLYAKSMLDLVSSAALASSLGVGVVLAALPVLLIEGGLTLLASFVEPILTEDIILHLSATGSLLIVALALNMLKLTKIKVMDLFPAILLPILFCHIL